MNSVSNFPIQGHDARQVTFVKFVDYTCGLYVSNNVKALTHGAIFLATCNAIVLLGDVKLANTCFRHSLRIYYLQMKHSLLIYIP